MSLQYFTDLVFLIDELEKDHFWVHLSCFLITYRYNPLIFSSCFTNAQKNTYVMNAPTYHIRILQPEFWWWRHVTNLPGFDESPLSGLRFAFFITMYPIYSAAMEVLDFHVSGYHFWQTFHFNLATAQQPLIWYRFCTPSLTDGWSAKRMSAKDRSYFMPLSCKDEICAEADRGKIFRRTLLVYCAITSSLEKKTKNVWF